MIYSNSWLLDELASGRSPKYLFFWGHRPSADGSVSASCLSQWWPAAFEADGVTYPTAEHWMMASKARLFGDDKVEVKILHAQSPAEAKKFGRAVSGFDAAAWDAAKSDLVIAGNMLKFSQHQELQQFLLGSGERVLVEASPVDPVWGIGLAADDPRVARPEQWRGENLLGYALMQVRDSLRAQQ